MKLFAITHAEKNSGTNPSLTEKGKADIKTVAERLPWSEIRDVVVGTGVRFNNILEMIIVLLGNPNFDSVRYSPLVGSADSGKKSETGFEVILADGSLVGIGDYIGLAGTPGVDLWVWMKSLSPNTLLCTGREFVGALGVKDAQMAQVYVIDTDTSTVSTV